MQYLRQFLCGNGHPVSSFFVKIEEICRLDTCLQDILYFTYFIIVN